MPTSGDGRIVLEPIDDEPPPRQRRPQRRAALLAAGAVGLGVLVAWSLATTSTTTKPPPSTAAPTSTPRSATTNTAASTALPSTALSRTGTTVLDDVGLPTPSHTTLVTRAANGDLLRVDVDRARVTRTRIDLDSTGPLHVVVEPERVLLRPLDDVRGYTVPDGGPPERLGGALAHGALALYPAADTGHVWLLDRDSTGLLHVDLVEITTGDVTATVPVRGGQPQGPDGTGHALVQAPGGAYAIGTDGTNRVTTGRILAAGPTRWVVLECDEHLDCTTAAIDRTSGARHVLGSALGPNSSDDAISIGAGTVSPDGRHAAFIAPARPELQLVDLDTGTAQPLEDANTSATGTWSPATVWSPDGRYLFYVSTDAKLVALDLSTGTVTTVLAEPLGGNQLSGLAVHEPPPPTQGPTTT